MTFKNQAEIFAHIEQLEAENKQLKQKIEELKRQYESLAANPSKSQVKLIKAMSEGKC